MLNPLGSVWQRAPSLVALEPRAQIPRVVAQRGVAIDRSLIERALRFFDAIPPFYADDTPAPLAIGGAWKGLLVKERAQQLGYIQSRNVEGYHALATNLFRSELSTGLANFGFTPPIGSPVRFELRVDCEAFERVSDRSVNDLATNARYPSSGMPVDRGVVLNSDPQHGVQATHILNIARALSIPLEDLVLLDLGSGYGGLSEKIHAWCAPAPFQILVDIPLNLTTAYIYLAHTFSEDAVALIDDANALANVDRKRVKFLLVPSCFINEVAEAFDWHIVHNAKSFSEMDADTVAYYMSRLVKPSTAAFIETNSNRLGSSNYGSHREVLARQIPVPASHTLFSRFPDTRLNRYVTSIYLNRALIGGERRVEPRAPND